jgi:hypothetical protein
MEALTFSILNSTAGVSNFAPACSVPSLTAYQAQKKIQVVSTSQLNFGNEITLSQQNQNQPSASDLFYQLRLDGALSVGQAETAAIPCYFPGPVIPGPGGLHCHEVNRGNLLFDQFKNLVAYDSKTQARLLQLNSSEQKDFKPATTLFTTDAEVNEPWSWSEIPAPALAFLHQVVELESAVATAAGSAAPLATLAEKAELLFEAARVAGFSPESTLELITLIRTAWHRSTVSGAIESVQIEKAALTLRQNENKINSQNLLYVLFELDAQVSYKTISAGLQTFAAGVFAGNFVEVALYPLAKLGATEFCVRERLFDEVINLVGRGFAPVVINELGLVADGNHRVTASWIWNILKFTADRGLDWSLDSVEFQKAAGEYFTNTRESAVSRHEALSHLAHFLSRPEYRSKLNTYIRPLLADYDYIKELPVVFLPEYLSQAVVKSHYDEGTRIERACPSVYETLAMNDSLVLPPRASYHFTDSALLPWFTVLGRDQKQESAEHNSRFRKNSNRNRLSARTIPTGVRNQSKKKHEKGASASSFNLKTQEKNK